MLAEEEQKPDEVKPHAITQRELILRSLPDETIIALTKIYEEVAEEIKKKNNNSLPL